MKAFSTFIAGAAAAAMLSVPMAAPAQAQWRHDRDRGIDAGDVIAGVAILGGAVAIASALDSDGRRYGYGYRDRYRYGYSNAVNACGREADRYGRGRVRILDVDRRSNNSYRVRGVIEGGYDRYDRGYDRRYDRDYGRYDHDRRDRDSFTCTARSNGRITHFRVRDRY
ncbi:hypothetical protein [Sphingosinicella rhizophila]|uniref:Uncharacterized protein n=1 Tax=Sphingosinicella rhizophila TaxID=3050082 RepID=A0ABU3Q3P1_9SPHN|nr:hypothetical protein [Sphingosinicella sp. GR2756]MDT9598019.1 hypothetical protein [Sphingosinicella sp. GR2756]